MSNYPTLNNAPITEAVIELRFPQSFVSFPKTKAFCDSLKNDYPNQNIKNLRQIVFSFDESSQVSGQRELGPELVMVTSQDQKRIFHFGKDRFSFSRVGRYSNWIEFSSEALKVWQGFQQAQGIKLLTRIGVRFINNLNLPKEMKDFSEFLIVPPAVPPAIPNVCAGFLTRVFLVNEKMGASAVIAQILDPNNVKVADIKLPVILDIDVYKTGSFLLSDTNLLDHLSDLRGYKNDIFFSSLTPKTLEFYK